MRRALILALLAAAFVPTAGYFADHVAGVTRFVSGQFVVIAYGPLVLVVTCLNPLLGRLRPNWRLKPVELAVVIMAMFVGSSIVSNGLLRYFTRALMMPLRLSQTEPGWREQGIMDITPSALVANDGVYDSDMVACYANGMGDARGNIGLGDVPWSAWAEPLAFWVTFLMVLGVASICLALIVHRQWTRHELLRYPTAEFARLLMDTGTAERVPIYRRRPFQIGAAVLLLYHLNNGLYTWFPNCMVRMPLSFDFTSLVQLAPGLWRGWSRHLFRPTIWPAAVAFAFLVPKDVAFSVGIAQPVASVISCILISYGLITAQRNYLAGSPGDWQRAASCIALAGMLAYMGRAYYKQVLASALLRRRPSDDIGEGVVWACRIMLLCLCAAVALLTLWLGLDWPLAVAFVLLAMVMFLTVARITAEVGLFYVQIIWTPSCVLTGLLGYYALGPEAVIIMGLLSATFLLQPEECLMPFVTQGLRIGDGQARLKPVTLAKVAVAALAVTLAAGLPAAVWVDTNYGGVGRRGGWDTRGQPGYAYREAARASLVLEARGQLEESRNLGPVERITNARPDAETLWASGVGFILVVLTYMARLRWPRFPIHPVMFLIWDTWAAGTFFASFLAAWSIRAALDRFGTRDTYQLGKEIMVGVIVGELVAAMCWMATGWICVLATGTPPPYYRIFAY